jgi:hypothetical protein
MARLLLLTDDLTSSVDVLPALGLLGHQVRVLPAEVSALLGATGADAPTSARLTVVATTCRPDARR